MKSLSIAFFLIMGLGYSQGNETNRFYIDYNNINLPESPNAASLGAYGNTMVNTATGIPNISIPIYTIEEDGLSIPISLSYHAAGVMVNDVATAVGLKWTLNAGGGIFRTVKGKPDEYGWLTGTGSLGPLSDNWYDDYDRESDEWQYSMSGNGLNSYKGKASLRDHNPDDFQYSFLNFSGKFILSLGGETLKNQNDELSIFFDEALTDIEDQSGNIYKFGGYTEMSDRHYVYANTTTGGGQGGPSGYDYDGHITGWMLKNIKTKNNKNVNFIYEPYTIHENTSHVVANSISYVEVCGINENYGRFTSTSVTNKYTVQLIKEIKTDNVKIEFFYDYDENLSTWKKKLVKIRINELIHGSKKDFNLEYEKFSGDPRLKLTKVTEVGYKPNNIAVYKPSYDFEYDKSNLPNKYSFSQDFFGYYNGANNISLIPDSVEASGYFNNTNVGTFYSGRKANRSLNPVTIQAGMLKKITYPTKGSTEFIYEPNAEIISGTNIIKYCGGLRVANIKDKNADGVEAMNTTYIYENLFGDNFESNVENTIQRNLGIFGSGYSSTTFNSGFVAHPNQVFDGYFYKKVTTLILDNGHHQRKEDHYSESYSFGKYNFMLTSEKFFKNNDTIKITEYQHAEIGTKEVMDWNILGNMRCIPKPRIPPTAPQAFLGYFDRSKVNTYNNWTNLPVRIVTTDFLKEGSSTKPVTMVHFIDYDNETLLKNMELFSTRYKRESNGSLTISNPNGEEITTYYTYPWSFGVNLSLPTGLLIGKEVYSSEYAIGKIFGQFFEYDAVGNIKKTYQYDKGSVGNTSAPSYVPVDYEEMTNFLFSNGKPVQVWSKSGEATSYIWGYNAQFPVAKIQGKTRAALNSQLETLVGQIETETNNVTLQNQLNDLRNHAATANAMVTTYTYNPLAGVETITDPKGDYITYHYDAFGRLDYVEDKDGKKLSENEYKYAH